jgi:hypothetical protein
MLSEIVLSSMSDAVFAQLVDHVVHDDGVRRWLGLDPARLAFQKAMARAYTTFARQYPDLVAALFDQSFLEVEAAAEIAKLLTRNQAPDPVELAKLWAKSIGRGEGIDPALVRGASDFCDWLNAELRSEAVFQPLFDSQTLDSLPKMEAKLGVLIQELNQFRQQALQIAESYEKTIQQRISVQGNQNIVGDHNSIAVYNQYFLGDTLDDLYIRPDSVFQRVDLERFAGREWLEAKIEYFLQKNKSGVFLLVGEAGVGKTTFMAHLVKQHRWLHLFADQVPGKENVSRALLSLGAQIVSRYQVFGYAERNVLPQVAGYPDFLDRLIREAAEMLNAGERLVIVCDALDEAGIGLNGNVFGLPKVLPDNVYLILSQRPASVPLNFEFAPRTERLDAQSDENLQDMRAYLAAAARRPAIAQQLRNRKYTEEEFVRQLSERSGGVWMYLHYIIREIENGNRHPLELDKLPAGLAGYYAAYWNDWQEGRRGDGKTKWRTLYAPLLGILAAVQQPVSAGQLALWSDLEEWEIQEVLDKLWRSFVTRQEDQSGDPLYRIYHASLRDFITGTLQAERVPPSQEYLHADLKKATKTSHQKIVTIHRVQCGGDWVCLAEQEYPRRYLAYHLAEAGELTTLYALTIESDAWAKEKFRFEGHYDSYLSDIAVVIDVLKKDRDVGRLMRAAFCQASILSSSGNISTELLNACVAKKVIPLEVALVYIGQRSDSERKFQGYFDFWQKLPEEQRKAHQRRLLTLAFQNAIKIYSDSERSDALVKLAPHLPAELMAKALSAARSIADESARSRALTGLAPHLPAELMAEALSAARSIANEDARSHTLTDLAPHMPAKMMVEGLTEALSSARSIADENARSRALTGLAPYLPLELMAEALSAARSIADEDARSHTLTKFAPHLPAELMTEALFIAHSIVDEEPRSLALTGLAPHLPAESKTEVLTEALSATCKIVDEYDRSKILIELVPHLSAELIPQVLSAACSMVNEIPRSLVLNELAPHLPAELRTEAIIEALSAARSFTEKFLRSCVLDRRTPHFLEELETEASIEPTSTARSIVHDDIRSYTLRRIAPHLLRELKIQELIAVLPATRITDGEDDCSQSLSELSSQVPAKLNTEALIEALSVARRIADVDERSAVLSGLTPHLPAELLTEVLPTFRSITNEYTRSQILSGVALYLPEELRKGVWIEVLTAVSSIADEDSRSRALSRLAPHLPAELLSVALSAAIGIADEGARAYALSGLASYLPVELLPEEFSAARSIVDEVARFRVLNSLAPYLPMELRTEACNEMLSAAISIADEGFRSFALAGLAPYLTAELLPNVLSLGRSIVDEGSRSYILSELSPYLPPELMFEALTSARSITDGGARSHALCGLALYLPKELRTEVLIEALSAVSNIADEDGCSYALNELAPHLPMNLQSEALLVAWNFSDESARFRALSGLASHMPTEFRTVVFIKALDTARNITDMNARYSVLRWLAPHLPAKLRVEALSEAMSAACSIADGGARSLALSGLASHLPAELRTEMFKKALIAARSIVPGGSRSHILSGLAPYMAVEFRTEALTEALSAARSITDKGARSPALNELAPNLDIAQLSDLFGFEILEMGQIVGLAEIIKHWQEIAKIRSMDEYQMIVQLVEKLSSISRQKLLEVVKDLAPLLLRMGGQNSVNETARAILDTGRWWP